MIHKDYCSKCKTKEQPLLKYSTQKTTVYYLCRPCNNLKAKTSYRRTGGVAQKRNNKNMYTKYPEKSSARRKVYHAVKTGKLNKSHVCEVCRVDGRIEGHHMDYDRPLEVVWLCPSCHSDYHSVL